MHPYELRTCMKVQDKQLNLPDKWSKLMSIKLFSVT